MKVNKFFATITDRYGDALKEPEEKPTLAQSIQAWALLNELIRLPKWWDYAKFRVSYSEVGNSIQHRVWNTVTYL